MAFIRARSPGRTRIPSVTARDLHSPELARDHLAFGLVRVQVQVCNQFAVDTAANKTAVGTAAGNGVTDDLRQNRHLDGPIDLPPFSWRRRHVDRMHTAAFAPLKFVVCSCLLYTSPSPRDGL